jgi:hypothetical protein
VLMTLVVGIAVWGNYVASIVILGGLALFIVLGNLRARRSTRK